MLMTVLILYLTFTASVPATYTHIYSCLCYSYYTVAFVIGT